MADGGYSRQEILQERAKWQGYTFPCESIFATRVPVLQPRNRGEHFRRHLIVMFHEMIRGAPPDIPFTTSALLPRTARVPYPPFPGFSAIEDSYAMIWRDRSDQGSSLCSRLPRSPGQTSTARPRFRRPRPEPGAGSSNRR